RPPRRDEFQIRGVSCRRPPLEPVVQHLPVEAHASPGKHLRLDFPLAHEPPKGVLRHVQVLRCLLQVEGFLPLSRHLVSLVIPGCYFASVHDASSAFSLPRDLAFVTRSCRCPSFGSVCFSMSASEAPSSCATAFQSVSRPPETLLQTARPQGPVIPCAAPM